MYNPWVDNPKDRDRVERERRDSHSHSQSTSPQQPSPQTTSHNSKDKSSHSNIPLINMSGTNSNNNNNTSTPSSYEQSFLFPNGVLSSISPPLSPQPQSTSNNITTQQQPISSTTAQPSSSRLISNSSASSLSPHSKSTTTTITTTTTSSPIPIIPPLALPNLNTNNIGTGQLTTTSTSTSTTSTSQQISCERGPSSSRVHTSPSNSYAQLMTLLEKNKVGFDDLSEIKDFEEDTLINIIQARYKKEIIYTYIGPILVSVNPQRYLPYLHSQELVRIYNQRRGLPPHLFAMAEKAISDMQDFRRDQLIFIGGESGSGKSENTKIIIQYLLTTDLSRSKYLRDYILESGIILESFGHASTDSNHNSSRWGKYFEMFYSNFGEIQGAKLYSYFLDENRVTYQQKGERNFHIFYQFLKGITEEEKSVYQLGDIGSYHYLNQGGSISVDNIDDNRVFDRLKMSFVFFDFPSEKIDLIFKTLSFIIILGNVTFYQKNGKIEVKDKSLIESLSHNITFDSNKLETILLSDKSIPVVEAIENRDSLARSLYSALFHWIIDFLNSKLKPVQYSHTLGILDLFGQESSQLNGYEQFSINFLEEQLQQIYLSSVLKKEQKEYVQERIQWTSPITFKDNEDSVEIMEKIISLLDQESKNISSSDQIFLEKLQNFLSRHKLFGKKQNKFGIEHYFGQYYYDVRGFIVKNRDEILQRTSVIYKNSITKYLFSRDGVFNQGATPSELNQTFANNTAKKSPLSIIKVLATGSRSSGSGVALSTPTPSTSSTSYSSSIVNSFNNNCDYHFIRCIKPNSKKTHSTFDVKSVNEQIKSLCLLETTRIQRFGYTIHYNNKIFFDRFSFFFQNQRANFINLFEKLKENDINIDSILQPPIQVGNSKIFLRFALGTLLESELQKRRVSCAFTIQSTWRMYLTRKRFFQMKSAIVVIQKHTRRWLVQKRYQSIKQATLILESFSRMVIVRAPYLRKKQSTIALQTYLRSLLSKQYLNQCHKLSNDDSTSTTYPSIPTSLLIQISPPATPPASPLSFFTPQNNNLHHHHHTSGNVNKRDKVVKFAQDILLSSAGVGGTTSNTASPILSPSSTDQSSSDGSPIVSPSISPRGKEDTTRKYYSTFSSNNLNYTGSLNITPHNHRNNNNNNNDNNTNVIVTTPTSITNTPPISTTGSSSRTFGFITGGAKSIVSTITGAPKSPRNTSENNIKPSPSSKNDIPTTPTGSSTISSPTINNQTTNTNNTTNVSSTSISLPSISSSVSSNYNNNMNNQQRYSLNLSRRNKSSSQFNLNYNSKATSTIDKDEPISPGRGNSFNNGIGGTVPPSPRSPRNQNKASPSFIYFPSTAPSVVNKVFSGSGGTSTATGSTLGGSNVNGGIGSGVSTGSSLKAGGSTPSGSSKAGLLITTPGYSSSLKQEQGGIPQLPIYKPSYVSFLKKESLPSVPSPRRRSKSILIKQNDTEEFSMLEYAKVNFELKSRKSLIRKKQVTHESLVTYGKKLYYPLHRFDQGIDPTSGVATTLSLNDVGNLEKIALEVFSHILQYMGDMERKKPPNQICAFIVRQGLNYPELRDEIYCQIIKQLTGHPGKRENKIRGWELMSLCCGSFSPKPRLLKYVSNYLYAAKQSIDDDGFATICFYRLDAITQLGPRSLPPVDTEIEAVRKKVPLKVQFLFPDDVAEGVDIDSATTSGEITDRLTKLAGLKSDAFIWSVFEVLKNKERSVSNSEYILDIVSKWENYYFNLNHYNSHVSQQSENIPLEPFQFYFKIQLFLKPDRPPGEFEIGFHFNQLLRSISKGHLPITENEVIKLSALRLTYDIVDNSSPKSSLEMWQRYIPQNYLTLYNAKDWCDRVQLKYFEFLPYFNQIQSKFKDLELYKSEIKNIIIAYLMSLPFYGSTIFFNCVQGVWSEIETGAMDGFIVVVDVNGVHIVLKDSIPGPIVDYKYIISSTATISEKQTPPSVIYTPRNNNNDQQSIVSPLSSSIDNVVSDNSNNNNNNSNVILATSNNVEDQSSTTSTTTVNNNNNNNDSTSLGSNTINSTNVNNENNNNNNNNTTSSVDISSGNGIEIKSVDSGSSIGINSESNKSTNRLTIIINENNQKDEVVMLSEQTTSTPQPISTPTPSIPIPTPSTPISIPIPTPSQTPSTSTQNTPTVFNNSSTPKVFSPNKRASIVVGQQQQQQISGLPLISATTGSSSTTTTTTTIENDIEPPSEFRYNENLMDESNLLLKSIGRPKKTFKSLKSFHYSKISNCETDSEANLTTLSIDQEDLLINTQQSIEMVLLINSYIFHLSLEATTGIANKDYSAPNGSFAFKVGNLITGIVRGSEGWCTGTCGAQTGSFPLEFLNLIIEKRTPLPPTPNIIHTPQLLQQQQQLQSSPLSSNKLYNKQQNNMANYEQVVGNNNNSSGNNNNGSNSPSNGSSSRRSSQAPHRNSVSSSSGSSSSSSKSQRKQSSGSGGNNNNNNNNSSSNSSSSNNNSNKNSSGEPLFVTKFVEGGSKHPLMTYAVNRFRSLTALKLGDALKHTSSPPTNILNNDLNSEDREIFLDIMKYMGDFPKFPRDRKTRLLQNVIQRGINKPGLRDEIYFFLCRQLTYNQQTSSPSLDSARKGMVLFSLCAGCFPSTAELFPYLREFLTQTENIYSQYCIKKLENTSLKGPRLMAPSKKEILSVKELRHIVVRIHLANGPIRTVEVNPSTTALEALRVLVDIQDLIFWKEFAIFKEWDGVEKSLKEHDKLCDVLKEFEDKEKKQRKKNIGASGGNINNNNSMIINQDIDIITGRFVLLRKIWIPHTSYSMSNGMLELMFYQYVHDVLGGRIPGLTIEVSLQLAALQLQAQEGDYNPETPIISEDTVYLCIPATLIARKELYEWVDEINQAHSLLSNRDITPELALTSYLEQSSGLPYAGSTWFCINTKRGAPTINTQIWIGINQGFIVFFNALMEKEIERFDLDEVSGFTYRDDSFSFLIGDLINPTRKLFYTSQGEDINEIFETFKSLPKVDLLELERRKERKRERKEKEKRKALKQQLKDEQLQLQQQQQQQ